MSKRILFLFAAAGIILGAASSLAAQTANPAVIIKTTKGDITLELFADKAPLTVKNFLAYVDAKFYDNTIFHRVIKGFMIQGGGLTADMAEKPTRAAIRNEATNKVKNLRGTIAMARFSAPHTATAQFFINHANNAMLDNKNTSEEGFGYCVFGKVTSGLDIVDAIAGVATGTIKGYEDAPRQAVTILSIRRAQ
ncbi:MAG: peptidylprolyl isomerase [Acidobacteriota bacterium]|nr:peptidylprolyl isomerase [Acidobacteriota bacterium]